MNGQVTGTSAEPADQALLGEVRRQRAELRGSMSALEQALAGPARGNHLPWSEHVGTALAGLAVDFRDHVEVTEGPEGLYHDLLTTAPRLTGDVARLTREHVDIARQVDDLLAECAGAQQTYEAVDRIRERGTALLVKLMHHRQRGSDLVFEAYQVDLGGET